MYLVEFFQRMTRKSNIPVLIYLILNVFVIGFMIYLLLGVGAELPFWACLLIGIVVYAVSLVIALSPVGEWLLRWQTGCKDIKEGPINDYLQPLFQEVYAKAKQADPSISDSVKLFVNDDETPNAFATGRSTICVTAGLLNMPAEQVKATLGHEFGHLAHKDTDLILVVTVGNMIVNGFIILIKVIVELVRIAGSIVSIFVGGDEGWLISLVNNLYNFAVTAVVAGLTKLWTWIGTLLVMKSSRSNEYEADEFSYNLGYGDDLCALLDTFDSSGAQGLFATLASSHPDKNDRIARVRGLQAGQYPQIKG